MVDIKKEVTKSRRSRSGSSSSSSSSGSSSSGSRSSSSSSSSSSSRSPSPKNKRRSSKSPARRSPARRPAGSRRSPSNDRRPRRRSGSPPRRRSPSPRRRQRSTSRGRERAARRSRTRSPRKASPPKKLCVRHLSRNVSKDHLNEIFAIYGALKNCELPSDRNHPHLGRGYGYIEYENIEDAEKAMKHMDGGQIDGQVIQVEITHTPAPVIRRSPPRRSPPARRAYSPKGRRGTPPYRGGGGTGGNTAPLGGARRFGGRSRSRSPVRRRRSRS